MLKLDFSSINVLVIGDSILDEYAYGDVSRMSPEAPVPVLHKCKSEYRLGGAANVANNLKAMGANPFLISIIGSDREGQEIESLLKDSLIDVKLFKDDERQTTLKTRFLSNGKQLLRVDKESVEEINEDMCTQIYDSAKLLINENKIDILIIQDYDKGMINKKMIEHIKSLAEANSIPICVDPKYRNFKNYTKVNLIKPNRKELSKAVGYEINLNNIKDAIEDLNETMEIDHWFVTLSEDGIYYHGNHISIHAQTEKKSIIDVCGAGDSVLSIVSLLADTDLHIDIVLKICNYVGLLACSTKWTSVVSINQINQILNQNT